MALPGKGERIEDLDELVRILDDGTTEEKCHALTLLCPCRNRVYDTEVWARIFRARESDEVGVRDKAAHAIGTLMDRVSTDPRSWELLIQLEDQVGEDLRTGILSIGLWGPRNRPSRRKRMTHCKTGRWKALASTQLRVMQPRAENP